MPTTPWGPDNPFFPGFEDDPVGQRANYFSFQDQFGGAPNRKKFFQGRFQETLDKYTGMLGSTIRSGGQPTQTLSSFLDDYFAPQGGAEQDWMSQSPGARGANDSRFAPQARWMLNSGPRFG